MIPTLNLSKHSHSISIFIAGASSALALGYLYCRLKCQKSGKVCVIHSLYKKEEQAFYK